MRTDLEGKTAVVTGASSGIGLAVCRSLVAEGMHVVLGARSADKLQAAAAELGESAVPVVTDVRSDDGPASGNRRS